MFKIRGVGSPIDSLISGFRVKLFCWNELFSKGRIDHGLAEYGFGAAAGWNDLTGVSIGERLGFQPLVDRPSGALLGFVEVWEVVFVEGP